MTRSNLISVWVIDITYACREMSHVHISGGSTRGGAKQTKGAKRGMAYIIFCNHLTLDCC